LNAGSFLVTVENCDAQHRASPADGTRSVRVYTNLHPDTTDSPISATVAGQIRSLRLDKQVADTDGGKRLNVIEIPLKASPKCIAVNSSTGHFAVGTQTRVLLYGLSSKKIAGVQRFFR